jgi:hypothetical protein
MLLIISSITPILGLTGAGTVTLTGSCSQSVVNASHNYVNFSLINYGNQSASGLIIAPRIVGAETYNSYASLQYLSPYQNYSTRFYLYNFSEPGAYADAFVVQYSQGSSTFYALFPCLVNVLSATQSLVGISSINQTGDRVAVSVVNLQDYPVNVIISSIVPPSFNASPAQEYIDVGAGSHSKATFNISYPTGYSASYAVAFASSYSEGGKHYSSIDTYTVNTSPAKSGATAAGYLFFGGIALIFAVLVVLIVISVIKSKKGPRTGST